VAVVIPIALQYANRGESLPLFRLQPVLGVAAAPCAGTDLPDPGGTECLRLANGVTVKEVAEAEAVEGQGAGGWMVEVALGPEDAAAFAEVTRKIAAEPEPRNRLAVVVDGEVLSAPVVREAITAGRMQIAGSFTRDEAADLARRLGEGR
jgi:preprotein translocase subunit SecD